MYMLPRACLPTSCKDGNTATEGNHLVLHPHASLLVDIYQQSQHMAALSDTCTFQIIFQRFLVKYLNKNKNILVFHISQLQENQMS